jgi:hypothetical protein
MGMEGYMLVPNPENLGSTVIDISGDACKYVRLNYRYVSCDIARLSSSGYPFYAATEKGLVPKKSQIIVLIKGQTRCQRLPLGWVPGKGIYGQALPPQ